MMFPLTRKVLDSRFASKTNRSERVSIDQRIRDVAFHFSQKPRSNQSNDTSLHLLNASANISSTAETLNNVKQALGGSEITAIQGTTLTTGMPAVTGMLKGFKYLKAYKTAMKTNDVAEKRFACLNTLSAANEFLSGLSFVVSRSLTLTMHLTSSKTSVVAAKVLGHLGTGFSSFGFFISLIPQGIELSNVWHLKKECAKMKSSDDKIAFFRKQSLPTDDELSNLVGKELAEEHLEKNIYNLFAQKEAKLKRFLGEDLAKEVMQLALLNDSEVKNKDVDLIFEKMQTALEKKAKEKIVNFSVLFFFAAGMLGANLASSFVFEIALQVTFTCLSIIFLCFDLIELKKELKKESLGFGNKTSLVVGSMLLLSATTMSAIVSNSGESFAVFGIISSLWGILMAGSLYTMRSNHREYDQEKELTGHLKPRYKDETSFTGPTNEPPIQEGRPIEVSSFSQLERCLAEYRLLQRVYDGDFIGKRRAKEVEIKEQIQNCRKNGMDLESILSDLRPDARPLIRKLA